MELLVRVRNKRTTGDSRQDLTLREAGDVLQVRPDGWNWGAGERCSQDFRVVRVPVTEVEARAMLSAEQGDRGEKPALWPRLFKLDLRTLRSLPRNTITEIPVAEFRSARTQKSPRQDPDVIGDSRGDVIG